MDITMKNLETNIWIGWEKVAKESNRILKDKGSFFLNVGGKLTDPWISADVANKFLDHYELQNVIHWIKSIAIPREDMGKYEHVKGRYSGRTLSTR